MALTKLNNNSLHAITDGSAFKNVTGSVLQVKQLQRLTRFKLQALHLLMLQGFR